MRKEIVFTVSEPEDSRDKGKMFLIKEMPASQAERWAMRALLAVSRAGVDLPNNAPQMGMRGIAVMGIESLSKISFEEAEPLLDEMMDCVSFIPNPANPKIVRPLIEDDIEEIATRIQLRIEVVKLHVNFSTADGSLKSTSVSSAQVPSPSSNTPTSPQPSAQFFQPGAPR